jgi:hypothetical protein
MPALNQNFTHWVGDTRILESGPIVDGNNNPVDLTGARADWWVSSNNRPTGTPTIQKSSTIPGQITLVNNAGSWTIVIKILPTDTLPTEGTPMNAGQYYHECRIQDVELDDARAFLGIMTLNSSLVLLLP